MNNNKPVEELKNINTIMFDRKGNMIRGDFGIADIIDLMEQRDDIKTLASYNASDRSHIDKIAVKNNHKVSETIHADSLKQCLREGRYEDLPVLVLLMPNYV